MKKLIEIKMNFVKTLYYILYCYITISLIIITYININIVILCIHIIYICINLNIRIKKLNFKPIVYLIKTIEN